MSESSLPGQLTLGEKLWHEIEQVAGCASWVYVPEDNKISFSANFSNLLEIDFPVTTLDEIKKVIDINDREKLHYTQQCMQQQEMVPDVSYKASIAGTPCIIKQWGRKYTEGYKNYIAGFLWVDYNAVLQEYETQVADLELYKMAYNSYIDCMLILNTKLEIIACNGTCERVTDVSREDMIGKNYLEAFPGITNAQEMLTDLHHVLKGRSVFLPVGNLITKGFYECHFLPMRKSTGEVVGILNVIRDVAHRVKTEKKLEAINEELRIENNELKLKIKN